MIRLANLPRAYFAAIVILTFGALCFDAGLWFATAMAAQMIKGAVHC